MASGDRGVSGRDWPWYVGAASGLLFLALGVWAMAGPESFFDRVATFEPYNQHFVQDIGAFQIGLGAVLLLAVGVRRPDALTVALLGVGIGSAAHVVSHLIGHDLGGTPETDIPVFSIATALLLGAGVAQWSAAGRSETQSESGRSCCSPPRADLSQTDASPPVPAARTPSRRCARKRPSP